MEKENILETASITQLIRKYSLPAIAASLVGSIYNIVDQIFVGQKMGTLGNAATNIAFPLVMLMVTFAMTLGSGGASHFSLFMGSGQKDKASQTVGNSIVCMIASGLLLSTLSLIFLKPMLLFFGARGETLSLAYEYTRITCLGIPFYIIGTGFSMFIRADGKPKYAMMCSMLGAVMNIVLDPLFIFVFDLGMSGAALATIIGQMTSGIVSLLYLRKFQSCELNKTSFLPHKETVIKIITLGLPAGITQLTVMAVQIVMNNVLGYYGERSIYGRDIPLACAGIVSKVSSVFNSVIMGISQSCQPLFGHNYGAKNYQRIKETYKTAGIIVTIVATVAFLLFQIFPYQILAIFGKGNNLYFEFGSQYLRIFMFCTFLNGIQILTSQFFPSIGKAKEGIFLSLSRQAFLQLPMILILSFFFGINGVLFAGPIADGLAGVIAMAMAYHQLKKLS